MTRKAIMSTYFSRADWLECFVQPGKTASWAQRPLIDERLTRRGKVCLKKLRDHIPASSFMLIRILRINDPPRQIEVEMHQVQSAPGGTRIRGMLVDRAHMAAYESHCAELIAIGAELVSRWPENARPRAIGLITDGQILAINPGRPEARAYSWLHDHLSGQSPCVPVIGETSEPFAIARMAIAN